MARPRRSSVFLEWREPQRLTRKRADQFLAGWSIRSRIGVIVTPVLLLVLLTYLWGHFRGESLSAFLPGAASVLGASALGVLALPWCLRHCPARVRIGGRGVSVTTVRTRTVPYGAIRRATFSTRVIDGYHIRTLLLDTDPESRLEVGIDSSVTPERIRGVLREQGVAVEAD